MNMYDKQYKFLRLVLLLALSFAIRLPGFPQRDDSQTVGYKPEIVRVDNHLSFIYHRDPSSATTAVQIFIKGGRKVEPPDKKGIALATARFCAGYPYHWGLIRLNALGSSISANVEDDFIVITITTLSGFLDETLDRAMDIIKSPEINSGALKELKKYLTMMQQQEEKEENASRWMKIQFSNMFFPGSGYSGSLYGSGESLKSISVKDIKRFYKKHVHPGNMVISVSSEIPKNYVRDIIKKRFKRFSRRKNPVGSGDVDVPAAVIPEEKAHVFARSWNQGFAAMAVTLPGDASTNYIYAYMAEKLLSGVHGKLGALRWEQGLAYSVIARVQHREKGSVLYTYLKTDPSKIKIAVSSLKAAWADLYQKGVPGEEFQALKNLCRVTFLAENETKRERSYSLGALECLGAGYATFESFGRDIEGMTCGDFNAYIKKVFDPGKRIVMVIGPGVGQ